MSSVFAPQAPAPTVGVSAPSPFMDENAVAAALGSDPLAIRRIAAKGAIKAVFVGPRLELRITPENLTAYVDAGTPYLNEGPSYHDGWVADYRTDEQAHSFRRAFVELAQKQIDDLDFPPVDNRGEPIRQNSLALNDQLVRLCHSPYPPRLVTIAGTDYSTPIANRLEAFVVTSLREAVSRLCAPSRDDQMVGLSRVGKLFANAEAYRAAVDLGWQEFGRGAITLKRMFPIKGNNEVFTWTIPHSSLPFDRHNVERHAF